MYKGQLMSKLTHEGYFEFLDDLRIQNINMYGAADALKLRFNLPSIIAYEILQEWFDNSKSRKQLLNE